MRYIFFGTPEFAAIVLEKLIDTGYTPMAVVCNPDEPVGRKQVLTSPPVKSWIMKHGTRNKITILQPKKLDSNFKFQILNFNPDLAIVAAYGKILPKEILGIPSRGFINVHPSLLPKYRGASPIQAAILNGDSETGVTIMEIDEEMDHGGIISNIKIQISNDDNYESLSGKLARLGAELLIKAIQDYISGKIKSIPQKHDKATYTKIIKKEDGKIDWSKSAEEIERTIRAYYPWPSSWTAWNEKVFHPTGDHPKGEKILKIIEVKVSEENYYAISEVFLKDGELAIKCGINALVIKKLQLEGGKVLLAKEFLNGHKDFIGSILK